MAKKTWQEMTSEERTIEQARKVELGKALIAAGKHAPGVKIESVAAALEGRAFEPTGGTDAGALSYSIPKGTVFVLGGKEFRVNNMSISALGTRAPKADFGGREEDYL